MTRRFTPAGFVLLLLFAAAFLCSEIHENLYKGQPPFSLQNPLFRVIGSAKEAVGDTLFLKADSYFHGGAEAHFEHGAEDYKKEGLIHEEDAAPAASEDWVARVNGEIRAHEHYHLEGEKRKEMLPFLALSLNLDPHNIEAILATAFWLDSSFGKTDEAIAVLTQARQNNPESWEIPMNLGGILFKKKHDFAASGRFYREALDKIKNKEVEIHPLIYIYYYLGECYERQSYKQEALEAYRNASALLISGEDKPLKHELSQKIRSLLQKEDSL